MAVVNLIRSQVAPITLADLKTHLRVDSRFDDDYISGLGFAALWFAENFCHRALMPSIYQLIMDHFPGYPEHYQGYTDLGIMGDSALGLGVPPVGYTYRFQSEVYFRAGAMVLPRPRLQGVDFIKYLDLQGTLQTLDPTQYQVDSANQPARVAPAPNTNWPLTQISVRAPILNAVAIQYRAGYTDYNDGATDNPPTGTLTDDQVRAALPPPITHALKLLVAHFYESRVPVLAGPRVDAVEVPFTVEALLYTEKIIYQ